MKNLFFNCCDCNFLCLVVLAFRRPASLGRCLASLEAAYYYQGHSVSLHISVDGPAQPHQISAVNETCQLARAFQWTHGPKTVVCHPHNLGIVGNWLAAWRPARTKEPAALFIEEDVELSNLFYHYVHVVGRTAMQDPKVYGVALQKSQWVLGRNEHGRWRRLDRIPGAFPAFYLFPAVGTWGQLLFASHWTRFQNWWCTRSETGFDGLITEKWMAEKGASLFSPWFSRFVFETGPLYNLYVCAGKNVSLAISHQDAGENFDGNRRVYREALASDQTIVDLLSRFPVEIPRYNHCLDFVASTRVIQLPRDRGLLTRQLFEGLQHSNVIIIVHQEEDGRLAWARWVCRFKQSRRQNAILVTGDRDVGLFLLRYELQVVVAPDSSLLSSVLRELGYSVIVASNSLALAEPPQSFACAKIVCPFVKGLYPDIMSGMMNYDMSGMMNYDMSGTMNYDMSGTMNYDMSGMMNYDSPS